jgi:hypothetical protein
MPAFKMPTYSEPIVAEPIVKRASQEDEIKMKFDME